MQPVPRRYPLILNPNARSAKGRASLKWVMENARRFVILATNHAEEARDLARKLADQGEKVVVAAGGDGTLNNVVQGLVGSQTALGILPTGTMNVFARELGLPVDHLNRALEVIDSGRTQEVDLFEANGHPFVQMAGVGFDAQIIDETSWESKKKLGPVAYLLSAIRVLGETPPRLIATDDAGGTHEACAVLVGNGMLYGGQFKLFPEASNSDHLLDVLVFKESGYRLVAEAMKGLAMGQVDLRSDMFEHFTTASLKVEHEGEPVPVEVDGELVTQSPVEFVNTQHRLKVFAPEERIGSRIEETFKNLFPWVKGGQTKTPPPTDLEP